MRSPLVIWLARRSLPVGLRLKGLRLAYMRMLGHLARNPDPAVQTAVVDASTALGAELATDLRVELGLGDSLTDADAAWAIGCQAFGLSYTREAEGNTITYDHTGCDLWAFYASKGECHCEAVCLPMVRSVTTNLAPSVTMTVDRIPTLERGCRKSLSAG